MDKLKLFTSDKHSIPLHIRKATFRCTGTQNMEGGLTVYHYLDREAGVRLTDTPTGLSIECNPTKFLKDNNYTMIGRNGLSRFMQVASEYYETDLGKWAVSLFDFNIDLALSHPPHIYLELFGNLKNWNVREYTKTGVSYQTKSNSKALTVYDLNERCRAKGDTIPEDTHPYVLRIEISINKAPHKIKQLSNMKTLADYTTPDNYANLPKLLLNTFEGVHLNEPVPHVPNLKKKEADIIAAIQLYTLTGYRHKLKLEYPNTFRYHYRQIDELLKKVSQHRHTLTPAQELIEKVRERAQHLVEHQSRTVMHPPTVAKVHVSG
ncbi:MAG: hypothetical protein EOP51_17160 [Sphingobacteriales bacterium]|nr:MAG: hypothetical protein EOP51_17160 [Sphingobacteriales bacterium]